MRLFIFLLLFSSCTILPKYKLEKRSFCERKDHDTFCPGKDKSYNHYPEADKGIYD